MKTGDIVVYRDTSYNHGLILSRVIDKQNRQKAKVWWFQAELPYVSEYFFSELSNANIPKPR